MKVPRYAITTTLAIASIGIAATTYAQDGPATTPEPAFHADAEVDPLAYALGGHSVHFGVGHAKLRLDLGAFALDLPGFVQGNDGFDASFSGFGVKAHLYPFAEQKGFFAGIEAGVARMLVAKHGTDRAARRTTVSAGVDVGVRIMLVGEFYVTPWIGVSYDFGAKDVALDGATYHRNPVVVFPTVHLGYRLR